MHAITIENFRCFREKQTARLAPLTLLVGENSTGKTSFLALLRALGDLAHDVPTSSGHLMTWVALTRLPITGVDGVAERKYSAQRSLPHLSLLATKGGLLLSLAK